MNLLQRRASRSAALVPMESRAGLVGLFETWQSATGGRPTEMGDEDFVSYVRDGMQSNGVLWALILMRMTFFSQMEFAFQNLQDRALFGNPTLTVLEQPWPNGSTAELLARMEQDVSTAGNAYIYRARPDRLQRLRPDWVEIVCSDSELLGYWYTPGGPKRGGKGTAKFILPDEMAHWSPYPDPLKNFAGMSWITPVVREVLADKQMTRHKQKFFDNAATPNLLIKNTKNLDDESRGRLRRQLEARYEGVDNAYRTLVLEGGADATIIGSTMQQMSFDAIQAAGENRVSSAAGVPGIVAGFKEGLQAATYSNYAQAKRHYTDGTLTFNWGSVCMAMASIMDIPANSRLWYNTSHIPALKEDRKDAAEIVKRQAEAMSLLVLAGYDPADVELYVTTGERPSTGLRHTGMIFSAKGASAEPDTGLVNEITGIGAEGETTPQPAAKALPAPATNGNGRRN